MNPAIHETLGRLLCAAEAFVVELDSLHRLACAGNPMLAVFARDAMRRFFGVHTQLKEIELLRSREPLLGYPFAPRGDAAPAPNSGIRPERTSTTTDGTLPLSSPAAKASQVASTASPNQPRSRLEDWPPLMTKKQLAAMLRVSERHIERLVKQRQLPIVRLSRRAVRFRRDAVWAAIGRMEQDAF
jgi:excisionase family DNA binding protein